MDPVSYDPFILNNSDPDALGAWICRWVNDQYRPPKSLDDLVPDYGRFIRLVSLEDLGVRHERPAGTAVLWVDADVDADAYDHLPSPYRGQMPQMPWVRGEEVGVEGFLRPAATRTEDDGVTRVAVTVSYLEADGATGAPVPWTERCLSRFLTVAIDPLGGGRCEVRVTNQQPALAGWVRTLVRDILVRWPVEETAPFDNVPHGVLSVIERPRPAPDVAATGKAVRVPSRPADLISWRETWRVIGSWTRRQSAVEIAAILKRDHTTLPHSPKTIRAIITAGRAGLLND